MVRQPLSRIAQARRWFLKSCPLSHAQPYLVAVSDALHEVVHESLHDVHGDGSGVGSLAGQVHVLLQVGVQVLEHEVQDGLAVLLHLSFVDDGDGKNREKSALSVCLRVNRFVARSTLTCSTERSFTT